jgi:hypothetical protein
MNINTSYYGVQVGETQQQPMRPTPLPTHKPSMTVARAQGHSQTDQFQGNVLRERPPIISSSREKLIMVDMFVNQNAIFWKCIERYDQKINELNQTKNDLKKQYMVHAKRLDNYKEQNLELEQQYVTLTKESRNKSEQSKSLSGQLVMLQFMNSKLESTLDQAGTSISYIHAKNRQQQLEIQTNRLAKQQNSLLNSKLPKGCQQKMNYKQFQSQQGTMNHSDRNIADDTIHLKQMCKIMSQQQEQDIVNHLATSSSVVVPYAATINSKRIHSSDMKLKKEQSSKYIKSKHVLPKFSKIMNKKKKNYQKRRPSSLTITSQNKLSSKEREKCNNKAKGKFKFEDDSEDSDDDDDNILVF